MILSRKNLFTYIVLVIVVVLVEYDFSMPKEYKIPDKMIKSLDGTVFQMHMKQYDTNESFYKYWGLPEEVTLVEDINESNTSNSVVLKVTQPEGKNILCIESSCYRLIGIYSTDKIPSITLYNTDLKEKVKSFREKDNIEANIILHAINLNQVEFAELNTSRRWYFKQFDVNQTKYEPKEIKK